MWRLLSTADRPDKLNGFVLSGVVNLPRALSGGIAVRFDGATLNTVREVSGKQISFGQEWIDKINAASVGIDSKTNVLLRITDRKDQGGVKCFTLMRYLSFTTRSVCVSPSAQVALSGVATPITADSVEDIFLPMNSDRQDNLPIIAATR
jgi:hypothetical protein